MAVIKPPSYGYSKLAHRAPFDLYFCLPGHLTRVYRAVALISADVVGFVAAFAATIPLTFLASHLFSATTAGPEQLYSVIGRDLVLLTGVGLYFGRRAHYSRRVPFWSALHDVVTASAVALLCNGFWEFTMQRGEARLLIALPWVMLPLTLMTARVFARMLLCRLGIWELRAILVGEGKAARQAEDALLSEPALGYCIQDVIAESALDLTTDDLWRKMFRQRRIELIILSSLDGRNSAASAVIQSLLRERVPFAVVPQLAGLPILGCEQTNFFGVETVMFTFRNNLGQPISRASKLMFDIAATLVLLAITSPLLALIAVAISLDGGQIFYAHRRVGAGGREFDCLKFRSMVPNADAVLDEILIRDPAAALEWETTFKLRNDPRVTPIGRFLRKTSLDELPQLFNVLRLEMSLVGPRPIVRSEMAQYGDDIVFYFETRPGVTGLWQVSGRSNTGYQQRVQLDTWYVKNWTLWHDIAILAKTVPAVLRCRGAV